MDDADLDLVRAFRSGDAVPPPGLRERIEEELWDVVLAEETRIRSGGRPRSSRRWFDGLFRPAIAGGAVAMLALTVALVSDGGSGSVVSPASSPSGVRQAGTNLLDSTATALFGSNAAATSGSGPGISPAIRLTEDELPVIAAGPADTADESFTRAASLPRDPAELRTMLRAAAAELTGEDVGDRLSFHLGMQWVFDPSVPADLRASMLRSLDGLVGIDSALVGVDVLGRTGVVVSHFDEHSGVREQYVLAPKGGTLLERRAFTTGYVDPACPQGTFTDHALFEDGEALDPAQLQWIDWPTVISACDPGLPQLS